MSTQFSNYANVLIEKSEFKILLSHKCTLICCMFIHGNFDCETIKSIKEGIICILSFKLVIIIMVQFFTTYTLGQVQTVLGVVLSILGIGWLFFISNVVKFKALRSLRRSKNGEMPILENIIPTNVGDAFRILRIKAITSVVIINVMVIFGITLTSFDGAIVINTVYSVESCKTTTIISKAQMVNNTNPPRAYSSHFEVDAMMKKRNKSEVPDGILVGQIPKDDHWKFNAHWDVDPYPCRGSCSLYGSGVTQVNMNYSSRTRDLSETFPELHAKYSC